MLFHWVGESQIDPLICVSSSYQASMPVDSLLLSQSLEDSLPENRISKNPPGFQYNIIEHHFPNVTGIWRKKKPFELDNNAGDCPSRL